MPYYKSTLIKVKKLITSLKKFSYEIFFLHQTDLHITGFSEHEHCKTICDDFLLQRPV
jgi:hypothetical protein